MYLKFKYKYIEFVLKYKVQVPLAEMYLSTKHKYVLCTLYFILCTCEVHLEHL